VKPVRLEVRGFTAFREPTTVEFEGRRLFVITGATGAGKSSLLDAMTWALYGRVPRIGSALKELVAQGEREMSVLLEFQVRDRTFRVARRFPSTTGTRLEEVIEGAEFPRPLADRASDVTKQVESILGMDYATFTRAIVLPQGDFDSFLRGEAKERRTILSQLIGLGVYEQAGVIARQRASEHRAQVQTFRTLLDDSASATPEAIALLRAELAQHLASEAALAERRQVLVRLRELATEERDRQKVATQQEAEAKTAADDLALAQTALNAAVRQRDRANAQVGEVGAAAKALAYDRAEHDRLRAQVALLDQRAAAEEALVSAAGDLATAERGLVEATAVVGGAAEVLKAARAAAKAADGEARAAEKSLATVAGRGLRARAAAEAEIAAIDADRECLETAARALEQRIRDLEALAATLKAASEDRARAEQHAARATKEVDAAVKAGSRATSAREKAATVATQAEQALAHARTVDAAAHIRATLKAGDLCPVCGEVIAKVSKHKAPAGLDTAERAHVDAQAAFAAAVAAEHDASTAVASARARAEGATQALKGEQARERALRTQAETLDANPDGLGDALKAARAAVASGTATLASVREDGAARRVALEELRDSLARVPGDIDPVESKRATAPASAVSEAVEVYRVAAQALGLAVRAEEQASRDEDSARRDLQAAEREVTRARSAHVEAQRRLEGLGGVEGKPEAIRRALSEADKRAAKAEELAEALRGAREALASASAALDAAGAASAQAQDRATARQAAHAAAKASVDEARQAFARAWAEALGETRQPSMAALRDVMEAHEAERERVREGVRRATVAIEVAEKQMEQAARLRDELTHHQTAADLNGAVGTELRGDRFVAFLLHESMQLLAADASVRLAEFTSGRYTLVADGDEFKVVDRLNGDEQRSVKTLSGGETFLASLALSLALSEHLADISGTGGAISLDSLFLDEGFGALDPESLDLAVQGLETLAEGSRMIGVISHVEELAERLPDRIRVEKGARGSTVVA